MISPKIEYISQTEEELGRPAAPYGYLHHDPIYLTKLAGLSLTFPVRAHITAEMSRNNPGQTALAQIVRRLVSLEPDSRMRLDSSHFVCYTAEWNFYKALSPQKAASNPHTPLVIHTTKDPTTGERRPVLIEKDAPDGDKLAIVCSRVSEGHFLPGMIGSISKGGPTVATDPDTHALIKDLDTSTVLRVHRPSTFVAFPPDVRQLIMKESSEGAPIATAHRTGSFEDINRLAQSIVDRATNS